MLSVCVCCCLVVKACPTLCNPMDCEGFTVHGTFQARILQWVAISFSRGIFVTQGSSLHLLLGRQILYNWATGDAHICVVGKTILGWYSIQRVSYSKSRKETLTRSNLQFLFYKSLSWVWHTGSSRVETIYPSWTEEPGGLQSTGLQRFGQKWETSLSLGFIMNSVVVFIC